MTATREEEISKLIRIEEELHKRVISQEKAISRWRAPSVVPAPGSSLPSAPLGRSCSSAPPASAKPKWPRSHRIPVRQRKIADPLRHVRVHRKGSVSKLIGSPPGIVGYEEGGQLTDREARPVLHHSSGRNRETASRDIYNILLQVFEDGQLTDGLGNTVDFKNTIVVVTSNLGARSSTRKRPLVGAPNMALLPPRFKNQVIGRG